MQKYKVIPFAERPDTMKKDVHDRMRFYSVPMLISDGDDSKGWTCSGTLCKIDQHYGIVTARHVWYGDKNKKGVKDYPELKIVIGEKGVVTLETKYLKPICPSISIESRKFDCKGVTLPDIIFIRIETSLHSKFDDRKKLFYPLDKTLASHGGNLYDEGSYWCTFGSPQELFDKENWKAANLIYDTPLREKNEDDGWDYLELDVDTEESGMPENLEGMSGGGIWRVKFSMDFKIIDIIFSGVNFYQTEFGKRYQIIGHGPKSIYENLFEIVKAH